MVFGEQLFTEKQRLDDNEKFAQEGYGIFIKEIATAYKGEQTSTRLGEMIKGETNNIKNMSEGEVHGKVIESFLKRLGWSGLLARPWFKSILSALGVSVGASVGDRKALAAEINNGSGISNNSEGLAGVPEKYKGLVSEYSEKNNVPSGVISGLMKIENPGWDPEIYTGGETTQTGKNTAFGLGQIIAGTWEEIRSKIKKRDNYDIGGHGINNAENQMYALTYHLADIKNIQGCTWLEAIAYYHGGIGIKNVSNAQALKNAENNCLVAKNIPGVMLGENGKIIAGQEKITGTSYFQAACKTYGSVIENSNYV